MKFDDYIVKQFINNTVYKPKSKDKFLLQVIHRFDRKSSRIVTESPIDRTQHQILLCAHTISFLHNPNGFKAFALHFFQRISSRHFCTFAGSPSFPTIFKIQRRSLTNVSRTWGTIGAWLVLASIASKIASENPMIHSITHERYHVGMAY